MYVLDDYKEGIIYAGESQADLQRNIPNDFYITTDVLNSLKNDGEFIWNNKNGMDYYIYKMSGEKLFGYMSARNCLNFIKGT